MECSESNPVSDWTTSERLVSLALSVLIFTISGVAVFLEPALFIRLVSFGVAVVAAAAVQEDSVAVRDAFRQLLLPTKAMAAADSAPPIGVRHQFVKMMGIQE